MSFVANFIRFPAVQIFWKSVKLLWSYRELIGGNFFETQFSFERWVVWYGTGPGGVDDAQNSPVRCTIHPSRAIAAPGTPSLSLSPLTVKQTCQEPQREVWNFVQSKSANNVCKLLQILGLRPPDPYWRFAPKPHWSP